MRNGFERTIENMREWRVNVLFMIVGIGLGAMVMLVQKNKEQERGDMYFDKC